MTIKYGPDDEDDPYPQWRWQVDEENPEATDEELAQFRPFSEVFPDLAASIRANAAKRSPEK